MFLVLRQNKGNHFAPGKIFITTGDPKSTFLSASLGRNEREQEPICKASKNRLKFYIYNKICQAKRLNKHFSLNFKLEIQKWRSDQKPQFYFLIDQNSATAPPRWYFLGKILSS